MTPTIATPEPDQPLRGRQAPAHLVPGWARPVGDAVPQVSKVSVKIRVGEGQREDGASSSSSSLSRVKMRSTPS